MTTTADAEQLIMEEMHRLSGDAMSSLKSGDHKDAHDKMSVVLKLTRQLRDLRERASQPAKADR